MTKQGSFKRAVRKRASETGERYAQARAALEKGRPPVPVMRPLPFGHAALQAHLETTYGIRITAIQPMAFPSWRQRPSTVRVDRADGPPWVARIFSSPGDEMGRVEGDAEILSFLASHDYPAERTAHERPVSVLDGAGVIVTEFVDGHPTADGRLESPEVTRELSDLLGRLHTLPAGRGATARDGGSWDDGRGGFMGRPGRDLAAAMDALVRVEDKVAPERRDAFERLRVQIENADDAEGLPEALTHGNYHAWTAVGVPGSIVIVGWAGSGRGPRLPAFAWHLWTSAERGTEYVDAALDGYRKHVHLTGDELGRLAGVLMIKPLYMMCAYGLPPTLDSFDADSLREQCDRLAERAATALRT